MNNNVFNFIFVQTFYKLLSTFLSNFSNEKSEVKLIYIHPIFKMT